MAVAKKTKKAGARQQAPKTKARSVSRRNGKVEDDRTVLAVLSDTDHALVMDGERTLREVRSWMRLAQAGQARVWQTLGKKYELPPEFQYLPDTQECIPNEET